MSSNPGQKKGMQTVINAVTAILLVAGSIWLMLEDTPESSGEEDVLFTLGGKAYQVDTINSRYRQPLYDVALANYRQKKHILEAAALEAYIADQASLSGLSHEQVSANLFTLSPPDEAALQAFYNQNKDRINRPYDVAKEEIAAYLSNIQRQRQQQELIAKLMSLKELDFNLKEPSAPFTQIDTQGYPTLGNSKATVTLIEFADYQCPHCKSAAEQLKTTLEPYLDRIQFIYMDFPIHRSGISRLVAHGAVCADQQGSFWDYNAMAFSQQEALTEHSPTLLAKQLGLNQKDFSQCLESEQTAEKVATAERRAIQAGVTATPTLFLNGRQLTLHDFGPSLQVELDNLLQSSL